MMMLAAPLLAARARVPDIVILLAGGMLLGPNVFGVLARDTAVTLFGSVGLLYIMFLAGLEIDLHHFVRTRKQSVLFGLLTFTVPQGIGTFAGKYLLGFDWTASILLASMFASHTLLAYPVASRLGISRSGPVAVTVGATILTDTLALLVLAVIADSARGESLGPAFWIRIGVGMAALFVLIWWGIPCLARWFFKNVTDAGGAQFLFVIVTVCACSYLSHFAKMEPIIGAFLAGAAFSRLIPEHSTLMNRVVFAGNTLFIPFFLISVGMLVAPGALLTSPRSWFVASAMVILVIVTKYIAAWLAARLSGYSPDAGRVMFGLSVVQAAATLAAVLVGYDLKIFDETVLNGAIAMIAVTCPLGAWMVERYGKRMLEQSIVRETPLRAEQRLLVPVSGPASAAKLLDLAFLLRDTALPGAIYPVTIVQDSIDTDESVADGEKLLARCLAHAASADMPVSPLVKVDVNASEGIVRAVRELRSSVVLCGWNKGQTALSRIFGTTMETLMESCPVRMYFCRLPKPLNTTKRLYLFLHPLAERRSDFAELLHDVKFLSRQVGADLRICITGKDTAELHRKLESARPSCPMSIAKSETLDHARSALLEEIGKDDIIFLPCERRSGILWTPTHDKFSDLLFSRFPEHNLIAAYPSLASYEEETLTKLEERRPDSIGICASELSEDAEIGGVLRQMAKDAFAGKGWLEEEAFKLLSVSASSYPVELAPGVILLHAHCERLEVPVLILGRGMTGLKITGIETLPHIILALLSPKTSSPERHLKSLADIGRCFHNKEAAEKIRTAGTAAATARIIEEKLKTGLDFAQTDCRK